MRMKILVDKMPESPEDCPYSILRENTFGDSWVSCTKGMCVCENIKYCRFFTDLNNKHE